MIACVSEAYIAIGKKADCEHCPIALAVRVATDMDIQVGSTELIYTFSNGSERTLKLPPKAVTFMRRFDGGRKVSPFSFEVSDRWIQRVRSRIVKLDGKAALAQPAGEGR